MNVALPTRARGQRVCHRLDSVQFPRRQAVAGKDVREHGSRNVGATNVARTAGKVPGIVALLLDIAKGWAAVALARWIVARPEWPFAAGDAAVGVARVLDRAGGADRGARAHVPGLAALPRRQGRGHGDGRVSRARSARHRRSDHRVRDRPPRSRALSRSRRSSARHPCRCSSDSSRPTRRSGTSS